MFAGPVVIYTRMWIYSLGEDRTDIFALLTRCQVSSHPAHVSDEI